jgi:hypothetical protein
MVHTYCHQGVQWQSELPSIEATHIKAFPLVTEWAEKDTA